MVKIGRLFEHVMLRVIPVKSDSYSGNFVSNLIVFHLCGQSSVGDLLHFMVEKRLNEGSFLAFIKSKLFVNISQFLLI